MLDCRTVLPVSRDPKIIPISQLRKVKRSLTDHEKIVYGYHAFEEGDPAEAIRLLSSVSQAYFMNGFHKDISRALLCQITFKTTNHPDHGKESEFYLVIYRLTKHIVSNKIHFNGSGHFFQLKDELFKGMM